MPKGSAKDCCIGIHERGSQTNASCLHRDPWLIRGCRLEDTGFGVGLRLLEILSFREKGSKRDIRLLDVLKFVHTSLWKYLFGHQARDLEQSNTVGAVSSNAVRVDGHPSPFEQTFCRVECCNKTIDSIISHRTLCHAGR